MKNNYYENKVIKALLVIGFGIGILLISPLILLTLPFIIAKDFVPTKNKSVKKKNDLSNFDTNLFDSWNLFNWKSE